MLSSIALVLFYLFTPLLILYSCRKYSFLSKLGSILIAYGVGLALGSTGLLTENSKQIQDILTTITIPIAIPLLLFSMDIKSWTRMAGKTVISLFVAIGSVVIMVITGFVIFKSEALPDLWKIGGLLIGVYTGGTPNLAALKLMLDVPNDTYILVNAYDMVISAVYFLFLISFGQRVFNRVLPRFRFTGKGEEAAAIKGECEELFWGLHKREYRISLLKAVGVSILIFAVAASTTLFIPQNSQMIVVILLITSGGIGLSFVPAINKLPKTFDLGMYFILIFSIVVASMVNFTELIYSDLTLMYYVGWVIFGSLLLQVVVSALFKIDTDTVIVSSTALICSPPFVPAVAGALKNKEIVVSGITVGIVGYAIGNYLGVIIAEFLRTF